MPNATPQFDGIAQAVEDSQYAGMDDAAKEAQKQEESAVKKLWEEYETARKFDKDARAQYSIDRRYAAGTADARWAVNTNLIGSFIDILVSFLYARNPDVSVRKSPQVQVMPEPGMPPVQTNSRQLEDLAKTMEIVISRLWKMARLKQSARKQVRSVLTTGPGWLKAVMIADSPNMPEVQSQMNDLRDNLAKLEALRQDESTYAESTPEEQDARIAKVNELMLSLQTKMEVSIRKYLAVDFASSQDVQISLDVANIEDHLDADWNADATYVLKSRVKEKFSRLTDDDSKIATCYYQRQSRDLQPITDQINGVSGALDGVAADAAEQYTTAASGLGNPGAESGPPFVKVVELWDKRTGHIKTMIDGVKRWAKEPYQPPYPSSRFYPYFGLAFYEVDGARHPQSLSWRLQKLQDEYARSRSNFRLTRERSIPGVIFNASGVDKTDMEKITKGVHQEMIGITPTDPNTPIQNLFAEKPTAKVDQRLFDNTPLLQDMEKISGVQEALQSSVSQAKTATEAEIQQSGFASRTTADRDLLESMLTDLANYTGEVALSALNTRDVQRIAGPGAFWPQGMAIDDLLTMVEIEIQAGTTGKPKSSGDRDAWGVIMPQIKDAQIQIQQARLTGNFPLAEAMTELLRETMIRMGDTTDVERFIPQDPPVPPSVPGAPGPNGMVPPPGGLPLPPGVPGGAAPAPHGQPGKPDLAPPDLKAPNLTPPVLQ